MLTRMNLPYEAELILFGFTSREWIINGDRKKKSAVTDYGAIEKRALEWCRLRSLKKGKPRWDDFTLAELAEGIGESAQLTKNLFQIILRKDFRTWKTERRIELASDILKEREGVDISELAAICGFKDLPNFSRQFKKITGCSPAEMRKRAGG